MYQSYLTSLFQPPSLPPFNEPVPEQTFLAKNYDENAKKPDRDPRGAFKNPTEVGAGKAGVVGPMGSSSFNLPNVERALVEMEGGSILGESRKASRRVSVTHPPHLFDHPLMMQRRTRLLAHRYQLRFHFASSPWSISTVKALCRLQLPPLLSKVNMKSCRSSSIACLATGPTEVLVLRQCRGVRLAREEPMGHQSLKRRLVRGAVRSRRSIVFSVLFVICAA